MPLDAEDGEVPLRHVPGLTEADPWQFDRTESVYAWRIFPEDLAPRARELVLIFRPSMVRELERAGALEGALGIWSLWSGYLKKPYEQRMQRELGAWRADRGPPRFRTRLRA
jgi:hypothetical protein